MQKIRINVQPQGKFSKALKSTIEGRRLSLSKVAEKVDSTYEHMRKLVGGHSFPSSRLLRVLADALGGDLDEWTTLLDLDRIKREFPVLPQVLVTEAKQMKRFVPVLKKMSAPSRAVLLAAAKEMLHQQNRSRLPPQN